MNRVTALLLAMATLLAHALAIHLDVMGTLAQPYESAQPAHHLARNLVREGALAWNVHAEGSWRGGLGAYASPLWVLVSTLAERLYLPVNRFTQVVGLMCALATLVYAVRWEEDRIAGAIPALLLVTCGGFAAPAVSGTEMPAVALLLTMSFVAFEDRRRLLFATSLGLLVATRPEGVVIAAAYLVLALLERLRAAASDPSKVTAPWVFAPAAGVAALLWAAPDGHGRSLYGSLLSSTFSPEAGRVAAGLGYGLDFVVGAVMPALVVVPLLALLAGRLSRVGRRALALGLGWVALVTLQGGGPQPFTLALAPALPLIAVAVQQGIVAALDTRRPLLEKLSWQLLLLSALLGAFASKFPGDVGPLKLRGLHAAWMETSAAPAPYQRQRARARPSLGMEIRQTAELRDLGRFLQRHADPSLSILTPWPGPIGYLSRSVVLDLFGRATAPPGIPPAPPWPPRRVDLLATFEQGADLVHLGDVDLRRQVQGPLGLSVEEELFALDVESDDPARRDQLARTLFERYELVTIPVQPRIGQARPFHLLRLRALGVTPQIVVRVEEGQLMVDALPNPDEVGALPQLVQLAVEVVDDRGRSWSVRPSGELDADPRVLARTGLRLGVGERPVRLYSGPLAAPPDGSRPLELRARLLNPEVARGHPYARASEDALLSL